MVTFSLCMIVKNEETVLARCLESALPLVEEIVIADTGSVDHTKEIAGGYTEKVYDFPWTDDFSAARNFSFSKATQQYCLWLDADDVIEPPDLEKFLELKASLSPSTDVVMARYHTAFDENGSPAFTYYRERIIRRQAGLFFQGAVHETIAPAGNVVYCEAAVTHRKHGPGDPDRNLRILEGLLREKGALSPREQFYYARELSAHSRDQEAADVFSEFLSQGKGWVENEMEACRGLAQCLSRLGRQEDALKALLQGLRYGRPRAELCCDLGLWFLEDSDPSTAVFWYEQALACERNDTSGGFVIPDCYHYIPYLQLCVCWYRLGNLELAKKYHCRAKAIHPQSAAVLYNEKFFS